MDRASDYGSEGCRFDSYRGHGNKIKIPCGTKLTRDFFYGNGTTNETTFFCLPPNWAI